MPTCTKVAIIGGGMSGIAMIKALKADGITPVCFEKTNKPCGTWCYRKETEYGVASVTSATIINHSKEFGAPSDHPYPAECPNYMSHRDIHKNFMDFAQEYDCLRHVLLNREVTGVKRTTDYEDTGRWIVTVRYTETDEVSSEIFDAVMICTGHIAHPSMPIFPGMDKFRGRIIHSHSLKTFESFTGQRVVVVGGGCSALDAAVEISNVASQVYLSMRTHSWIMPRVGPDGAPFDYILLRRHVEVFKTLLPIRWISRYMERYLLDSKFKHHLYGIYPKYPLLCRDPVINDFLPAKLLSGSVILKGNITEIDENNAFFENDSSSTEIDTIIMATGYTWEYPYLEDGILVHEPGGKFHLYKCMYPPHLKHPTLAFIGFLLPFGPGFSIGEIQIRWASFLLSGHGTLPSRQVMMDDIEKRYRANVARYSPSDKMSQRVDYIPYMDDIASQFGVKPNFWKMVFTDPKLFTACVFGPCVPYQYRLVGPHKWDGARNAILTTHQRMKAPLAAKKPQIKKDSNFKRIALIFASIMFLIFWLYRSISGPYYLLALILPYLFLLKGTFKRYMCVLLLLPFLITWENFLPSYLVTLFLPILVSSVTL